LDRIDIKILAHLHKNGRMTNAALAGAVGLSASPCLARVKRLEKLKYIVGYGAYLDASKLGPTQIVFAEITLSDHRKEDFSKFEAVIKTCEALVECHLVSGGFDYLLKLVTRDIDHYQSIVDGWLERRIGIRRYFTYVVIKSPIIRRQLPFPSNSLPGEVGE
jgi:DNA-binding Lrp family transcriptional regulator